MNLLIFNNKKKCKFVYFNERAGSAPAGGSRVESSRDSNEEIGNLNARIAELQGLRDEGLLERDQRAELRVLERERAEAQKKAQKELGDAKKELKHAEAREVRGNYEPVEVAPRDGNDEEDGLGVVDFRSANSSELVEKTLTSDFIGEVGEMIAFLKAGTSTPLTMGTLVQAFSDRYELDFSKLQAQFKVEKITLKSNPAKIAKAIAEVIAAGNF